MASSEAEVQARTSDGWEWGPNVDPNCGEYGLYVNQGNNLRINPGDASAAITGIRIILNNQFASMPVCGHGYASAQFIGRGSTEVSMQIAGVGDYKISDIQAMHETLEKNARQYRRFTGAGRVRLTNNPFLRLAGIEDGIITSIDTETDPGGTNLYRCQIALTSDGHHTEGFRQEIYTDSETYGRILEVLLQRVNVEVRNAADTVIFEGDEAVTRRVLEDTLETLRSLGDSRARPESFSRGNDPISMGLNFGADLVEANFNNALTGQFNMDRLVAVRRALNGSGHNLGTFDGIMAAIESELSGLIDSAEDGAPESLVNDTRDRNSNSDEDEEPPPYGEFPIRTPTGPGGGTSASYTPNNDEQHSFINRYVQDVCDVCTEYMPRLPSGHFFRGAQRGRYYNYRERGPTSGGGGRTTWDPLVGQVSNWPPMLGDENSTLCGLIHGRRSEWTTLRVNRRLTGRHALESVLMEFEEALMRVARSVQDESSAEPHYNELFSGATEAYLSAPQRTAHPTYPDLELPPHPVSNLSIDTEPDYFFFNDGEEGMLNHIGPDLVRELDIRLENMENSFHRLASGTTWSETYLGRSRIGPAEYDEEQPALDDRNPYQPMDGGTSLSIDAVTSPDANWGPEGGRSIGGGAEPLSQSVVDTVLGMSSTVVSTSNEDRSVLRNRRLSMIRNTALALPQGEPSGEIGVGPVHPDLGPNDRSHSFQRNALRTILNQSIAESPEETLTMRRAFPSFKIYFIEDDTGAMRQHLLPTGSAGSLRPIMFFDDLYNYNSVKSIRLIRSRKNPTDLLILQLTNVQGLLERRRWIRPDRPQREIYAPGFEETEMENPLKKIIMKEGLKVQARLGYTNNPHKMGNKFIGEVVEVSYNAEVSDEVTIICQSYGAELTLDPKGLTPSTQAEFVDTPDLIHTVMCSPELVHFGRYNLNPQFNPGEARSAASSRDDPTTGREAGLGLLSHPRQSWQQLQHILCQNRSKWLLANNPADDNIFAPGIRDHLSDWERVMNDAGASAMTAANWIQSYADSLTSSTNINLMSMGGTYVASGIWGWLSSGIRSIGAEYNVAGMTLTGQTIWEILKESELRHPGWIAQPRPYGTRMTLFFGVPSHQYWADEISREEMLILKRLGTEARDAWRGDAATINRAARRVVAGNLNHAGLAGNTQSWSLNLLSQLSPTVREYYLRTCQEMAVNQYLGDLGEDIGTTMGRFRPFRRYHLLTSENHILLNNIRASQRGVFNAVCLQYKDGEIYTLKADDDIPDELTRVEQFSYQSCDNDTMARRYCIGLLNRHLKDIYKGEIVVTGMDVDPYDMCYLHDDRLGMYGGFEIEQVVDTFTAETGWITEITPDLITGTNEWATMSTGKARTAILGELSARYVGVELGPVEAGAATVLAAAAAAPIGGILGARLQRSPTGAVVGAVAGAGLVATGAMIAWYGGYDLIKWSQDRQPIWMTPLVWGERPLIAGVDGFKQDGIFASIRGEMHASFDAVREGWRQLHLASFGGDISIGLAQQISGQAG